MQGKEVVAKAFQHEGAACAKTWRRKREGVSMQSLAECRVCQGAQEIDPFTFKLEGEVNIP